MQALTNIIIKCVFKYIYILQFTKKLNSLSIKNDVKKQYVCLLDINYFSITEIFNLN